MAHYLEGAYYFAIFAQAYRKSEVPEPDDAVEDELAFLALSFDAKIYAGHWQILGNARIRPDLPLPAYKEAVGAPDQIYVVDYTGQERRRASAREIDSLRNRTFVAPVRLEKALRAKHGLETWTSAYEELRPDLSATTKAFFPLS